ncbi:hypothetical protein PCANC_28767, partial [Puccinia coronata f. sp. avenae]
DEEIHLGTPEIRGDPDTPHQHQTPPPQQNLSRRQARWTEIIADFDLYFEYIKGEDNSLADALLRKNSTGNNILPTDTLPEKLDWMATSNFILDAAIQFKLRRAPPSESLTDSNSAARAFGHQV